MEAVLVLFGLVLAGLALIAPILSLISFARGSRHQVRLDELQVQIHALEARFEALRKLSGRGERFPEPEITLAPAHVGSTAVAAAPVARAVVLPPIPTTIPAPQAVQSPPVAPPSLMPAAEPAPPPSLPPPPTPTARAAPEQAPPAGPTFDWESLLGLRGAAWLGGIALVIAGLLFAKLAIDNGYYTPELRVATMLVLGVGALIGADVSLRRGYATAANAVSGAGIATLYTCFFAAYDRYHLLSLAPTFALMVLVTAVACLLSIRYDAFFVAILGLLGGFATPLVLSTGQDRPLGLFSYVLLLNLGLFAVSLRQRWHGLAALTLVATVLIQIGWFARFMEPAKLVVGLGVFALFGLLYLLLPDLRPGADTKMLRNVGSIGGLVPFFFALLIAGQATYSTEWPLLFGFVALLDLALLFIGLYRDRPELPLAAAVATALTLPLWASQGLTEDALYGPTLVAVALTLLLNAPGRLTRWFAAWNDARGALWLHAAGIAAGLGLAVFTIPLVGHHLGEPPWAYLLLLAALVVVLLERTREELWPGLFLAGALALALLTQLWFASSTDGPNLLRNLAVPLLLAIVFAIASASRSATRSPEGRSEYESAVVTATLVAVAGLHGCLASPELGADPWPLFGALAVADVLLVSSALRRGWAALPLVALAVSTSLTTLWQLDRFQPGDMGLVLPIYAAFYLAFLVLPFVLPTAASGLLRTRFALWATSALAGPCFFLPLYWAVTAGWGKAAIGLLPVAMAALSVIALFGVLRRFPADTGAATDARQLDRLALFAAIALGFVALAIPLQLDRQWITVAWALEAVAVWWLLERLPHPGLRLFGALLFASVGARLLFNWDSVLHYEVRGLPIVNWLLYGYGVPALCCLVGARLLKRAEDRRSLAPWPWLSPATAFMGLVLLFALVNLEIADYFSVGAYVQIDWERRYARDLTMSVAWGVYAIVLLGIGVWRGIRVLRFVALGFLVLTVLKVFLFDLSALDGFYRVLSFLGLGVALILVSLVYQRFVVKEK